MKKYLITMLVCLLLCGCFINANAATKVLTAEKTESFKSILGLQVIQIKVSGRYEVEDYRITKKYTPECIPQAIGHKISEISAYWVSNGSMDVNIAECHGKARFTMVIPLLGIPTGLYDGYQTVEAWRGIQ